jgi:hypothetical protein
MNKTSKRRGKSQPSYKSAPPTVNIALSVSISKDELKQIIVEAYFEIESEKETC